MQVVLSEALFGLVLNDEYDRCEKKKLQPVRLTPS